MRYGKARAGKGRKCVVRVSASLSAQLYSDEKYRSRNIKYLWIYMPARRTESESSARNDKLRDAINGIFESRTLTICSCKTDNVQFPSPTVLSLRFGYIAEDMRERCRLPRVYGIKIDTRTKTSSNVWEIWMNRLIISYTRHVSRIARLLCAYAKFSY